MTASTERSLTVTCWAGLGNRLRVLVSGLTAAEASGRRFTMLWPRTQDCAVGFIDLFVSDRPVADLHAAAQHGLPLLSGTAQSNRAHSEALDGSVGRPAAGAASGGNASAPFFR